MYRRWKESKGKDKEYENIIRLVTDQRDWNSIQNFRFKRINWIFFLSSPLTDPNRKQVVASQQEAEKDKVHVPTTIEEYCIKHNHSKSDEIQDFTDFYDDYMDDMDDPEDEDYDDDADELESDQEQTVNKPGNPAEVQNGQPASCLVEKTKLTKQKVEEDSGNEELWAMVTYWIKKSE